MGDWYIGGPFKVGDPPRGSTIGPLPSYRQARAWLINEYGDLRARPIFRRLAQGSYSYQPPGSHHKDPYFLVEYVTRKGSPNLYPPATNLELPWDIVGAVGRPE